MNVDFQLNDAEQAALLQLAEASGKGVEEYLHDVVRTQIECERESAATPPKDLKDWKKRLEAAIALHPSVGHVDASRESIYGNRGR